MELWGDGGDVDWVSEDRGDFLNFFGGMVDMMRWS